MPDLFKPFDEALGETVQFGSIRTQVAAHERRIHAVQAALVERFAGAGGEIAQPLHERQRVVAGGNGDVIGRLRIDIESRIDVGGSILDDDL